MYLEETVKKTLLLKISLLEPRTAAYGPCFFKRVPSGSIAETACFKFFLITVLLKHCSKLVY